MPPDPRAARLRELLTLLGERLGAGHGWKTRAAGLLGVSQAHFSRVLAGKTTPGNETIDGIARVLHVNPGYFSAPPGTPPDGFFYDPAPRHALPPAAALIRSESPETFAGWAEAVGGVIPVAPTPQEVERLRALSRAVFAAAGEQNATETATRGVELATAVHRFLNREPG